MKEPPATSSRNGAGAGDLPSGVALPVNVVSVALKCSRLEVLRLIEEDDLPGAVDLRSPGSSRATIRIPRQSVITFLEARQKEFVSGETNTPRTTKRARIAPTKERRDRYGPAEALLQWLRAT